jgi:hypothetical protein
MLGIVGRRNRSGETVSPENVSCQPSRWGGKYLPLILETMEYWITVRESDPAQYFLL